MKVCVIGLGRFGYSVATTLAEKNMEVLAVDSNDAIIASIKDSVTQAVCANITNEETLRNLGVEEMDVVVVAMGENFAQSILITALLKKRLHVNRVITRSINTIHQEILTLIGADETIIPEQDIGIRLAERLSSPFEEFFRITNQFSISQIPTPASFIGNTVATLNLYKSYQVRCIGIKVDEDFIPIAPDYSIKEEDVLLFVGKESDLKKIARL
ncbi:TrkA family potassium uptake protein [Candidatus Babeliales bacterium]|nr:TrkA family potassium uptake protein [Candidatus Babeliales bacterium]